MAVTATGITVPLLILYLSSRHPEIRISLVRTIDGHLTAANFSNDDFIEALADAQGSWLEGAKSIGNGADGISASPPSLVILHRMNGAATSFDHETRKYKPFPQEVVSKIFLNRDGEIKWFSLFHEHETDRNCNIFHLGWLVALGVFCVVDMYFRLFVTPGPYVEIFEVGLSTLTMAANIGAYVCLAALVIKREAIRVQIDRTIDIVLWPDAFSILTSYKRKKVQLAQAAQAQLQTTSVVQSPTVELSPGLPGPTN